MRRITPALQSSQARSRPWSGARLVNAFAEMAEGDKASEFAVMAIPGLVVFSTIAGQQVRGMHVMDGVPYVVVGTTLVSLASDGSTTNLGTVGGSLPVQMADNGTQLAIQGGALNNQGYVLSSGTLYTGIANLPPVSGVVYVGGYFLWPVFDSDQFIISSLTDGLLYDPLDVATVEGDPDNIVGVSVLQLEVLFSGSRSTEVWWNSGNADFPFERQGNTFIERGCFDRDSIVKIDNSVHFVGEDRIVYRLNGYLPTRISTHGIEYQLARASWFRAFTYTADGHKFYVLNTDIGTFVYDMATGAWHDRRSLGRDNYRVGSSIVCYDRTLMGDAYAGLIYYADIDVNTENGDVIPVEVTIPSLQTDRLKATLYAYELQCQTGVGTSLDSDPQVILQWSKDGGNTWSAELTRTLGAVGEYLTRCIWRVNVSYRQLQLRLKLPSITQRFVIAHYVDAR